MNRTLHSLASICHSWQYQIIIIFDIIIPFKSLVIQCLQNKSISNSTKYIERLLKVGLWLLNRSSWVEGGLHSSSRFRFCPAYPNVDVDDLLGVGFLSTRISEILRICANFCSPVSLSLAKNSEGGYCWINVF